MNHYTYKDFTIEVFDYPDFKLTANFQSTEYRNLYFGNNERIKPASIHGIKVFIGKKEISSALVLGSRGTTGVYPNSSLLDHDQLVLCCCNIIFCFALPLLTLKWQIEADEICCFKILQLPNAYLVHGEMQISRLSRTGVIEWEFSGNDIFVSPDSAVECMISGDRILLTDFSGEKYTLDLDGNIK